jgi:hypothetical protein
MGLAHPCSEELTRKAGGTQAGKFAEQIELAFSDEVETRIRYREMITDVLISNSVFFNMMHVDAKDAPNIWLFGYLGHPNNRIFGE